MNVEIPGTLLILGYKEIFGEDPPNQSGRIALINGIDKDAILHELASLNLRQLPPLSFSINDEEPFQMKMLHHLSGANEYTKKPYIQAYDKTAIELRDKGLPVFFNRPATLFAIQEIISQYNPITVTKDHLGQEEFARILKYYACVNSVLAEYRKSEEASNLTGIERLTSASVFINELMVVTNPFQIFDRYVELISWIRQDPVLRNELQLYFESIGFTPEQLVLHISGIYINNVAQNISDEYTYLYHLPESGEERTISESIFNFLSRRGLVVSSHTMEISEIKKSPVYFDKGKGCYLLLDSLLLAEKLYESFINDFWFDHMKGKLNIAEYRGYIGRYFEEYCFKVLQGGFINKSEYLLKSGKELIIETPNGQIELADGLLLKDSNVCLFEFKSSGVYTDQKQSTELSLYRSNPEQFYESFGISQLANGIINLRDRPGVFKVNLEHKEKINVFPILVVNEKVAMNPYLIGILNDKLREFLKGNSLGNLTIFYLTVFHVSDLESLCSGIDRTPYSIFEVCNINSFGAIFPRPVGVTMNRLGIKNKNKMIYPKFAGYKNDPSKPAHTSL